MNADFCTVVLQASNLKLEPDEANWTRGLKLLGNTFSNAPTCKVQQKSVTSFKLQVCFSTHSILKTALFSIKNDSV